MAESEFKCWRDTPFNTGTEVDLVDLFTGTGSQTDFDLVNKPGSRVGSTIQSNGELYRRYDGGFTVNVDTVELATPPQLNAQIVVPGVNSIVLSAYDQDNINGVADSRVYEKAIYLGSVDDINEFEYLAGGADIGIKVFIVDNATAAGATTALVQIACSNNGDAALTYAATGDPVYVPGLSAFGLCLASTVAGASSVMVSSASDFMSGFFIYVNPLTATGEVRQIESIDGDTLNLKTAFDFPHAVDEPVYLCAIKMWLKLTIPIDFSGGLAQNLYDLSLNVRVTRIQRE